MPPPREATRQLANKTFVDREEPQRIFEKAAFAIPADGAILRAFYGVGGQGKTALCRELMRKTAGAVEPSYRFHRRALLDLHGKAKTDPDLLLVWIRNEFARAGLFMPCFDLALALMWEGARSEQPFPTLLNPWLGPVISKARSGVDEGADKAGDWLGGDTARELLGEVITQIPGVGFVLRKLGHWAIDKAKTVYLERTRDYLQRLYRDGELVPSHELSAKWLPWMLAQDLNHHISEHPEERFVLFIDEYERVFDEGGAGSRWRENPFDRHMRAFVQETNGLLAVFFSRERLPWGEDPEWHADLADHQHLLNGLADTDADDFLRAVPIGDLDIRRAIIDGARETSDVAAPVYPLMLDLQVEHWRILAGRGKVSADQFGLSAKTFEARSRELIERVLRDYGLSMQATIERLSVLRRFDKAVFEHVVRTFATGLPLDSFERIIDLSFVTMGDEGYYSFHNIIAAAVQSHLSEAKRRETMMSLFAHFRERAQVTSHFELSPARIGALFDAADLQQRLLGASDYVAWLQGATEPLRAGGRWAELAALWRDAVTISEKEVGVGHPVTGLSLNNLALLLQEMGDYAGALQLYKRALAISEKVDGPEHLTTGTRLNNLAALLHAMGDYRGARRLFEQALEITEKAAGIEHPLIGACLNNFASLLHDMGDYDGALSLYGRALAISENAEGPDHPTTGLHLSNLAAVRRDVGDYAKALALFERALAISEKVDGPEHPATGQRLNNLAGLLHIIGDYVRALSLYERALAISEKVHGLEHPLTATYLNNIGNVRRDMRDYVGAVQFIERALSISKKAYGPEHPLTGRCVNNLASILKATGDCAGALPLFIRALKISEMAVGPDHPWSGIYINNLADCLRAMGDYSRALPLFKRALAISEKVEGPEHASTATSLNNLGFLLQCMGDFATARPHYERALTIFAKSLGPEHPSTISIRRNLESLPST